MTDHADGVPALPTPRVGAFLVQGMLWNMLLFGLLRLAWVDRHLVQALADFQQTLARWYAGAPHLGLVVGPDCSGTDVVALCAAVSLAYPVPWPRRLAGVATGAGVILALDTIRIATLFQARTDLALARLHTVVWPSVLVVAAVLFVLLWIHRSERRAHGADRTMSRVAGSLVVTGLAYAASVPWVFPSVSLREAGVWTAAGGAAVLHALGAAVQASGDTLVTARGGFQVTPECLFTPILPVYLAAVWSLPMPRSRRGGWLIAAIPLFFALGVVRLLLLALPPLVADHPVYLAHGFYQFVAGITAIVAAAHLAHRREQSVRSASIRTLAALGAASVAVFAVGDFWQIGIVQLARIVHLFVPATIVSLTAPTDQQGALALLPTYQLGLLVGLVVALDSRRRWGRAAAAVVALASSQVLFLAALGSIAVRFDVQSHALVIRAWAILAPLGIALLWAVDGAATLSDAEHRRFWWNVGKEFPTLTGAASTHFYSENEKRLLSQAMPVLNGRRLLKTDLWDEAKNTRILQWVADRGAQVYGVDISEPIVREAIASFASRRLRPAVSDVRRLPYMDGSFDAIYSMGTIEHVAETEDCVVELARVLKPGGRLILGVPNRLDPFLRPALVWMLSQFGLYSYGFEKSYTRGALRRMIEKAGLEVQLETGILFVPGWLRMLDLWCHTRCRHATFITGMLITPFVWLDGRFPALRRHGYLLASVGVKPVRAERLRGLEHVVDAHGCDPALLRSQQRLERLFEDVIQGMGLKPVAAPLWHVFPYPGGITGLALLAESHLTIHTYPEFELATINLYCCRNSAEWAWEDCLRESLAAREVTVRTLPRGTPPRT